MPKQWLERIRVENLIIQVDPPFNGGRSSTERETMCRVCQRSLKWPGAEPDTCGACSPIRTMPFADTRRTRWHPAHFAVAVGLLAAVAASAAYATWVSWELRGRAAQHAERSASVHTDIIER